MPVSLTADWNVARGWVYSAERRHISLKLMGSEEWHHHKFCRLMIGVPSITAVSGFGNYL